MPDKASAVATLPTVGSPSRSPERSDGPWYSSESFWLGPFLIGLGLLVAVGVGVAWYVLGGFPRDHDKYGSVSVPGQRVVKLPAGDVRVNFENDASGGTDNHLQDRPRGLSVRFLPATGGEPIAVKHVPGWLFSSTGDRRGHEPFGKLEIPRAGRYRIQATDDRAGGFDSAAVRRSAPADDSGPEITVGQRPWSPLGSVLLGAILAGILIFLAVLVPTRLANRRLM